MNTVCDYFSTFKGFGYYLYDTKHKCPQNYIKIILFKDKDGRKLPLEYDWLRFCSVLEMSRIISQILFWHEQRIYTTLLEIVPSDFHPFFFFSKTWLLMKLKLLQVNYITNIFMHSEQGFMSRPKTWPSKCIKTL